MIHNQSNKNNIDAVILCGGKGTRLHPVVPNMQKCVADIGGKPFLDILIDMLVLHNFRRIILAAGYLSEQVVEYVENRDDFNAEFSFEEKPLGTGGALKNTKRLIKSDHFLVMNGDSFCPVHLPNFYDFHFGNNTLFSLVASKMQDVSDYGSIEIDDFGRIIGFYEKESRTGEGFVNAGVYLMRKDIFDHMPDEDFFSLEQDLFPKLLDKDCYTYVVDGKFFDIGTPERYAEAQKILSELI